MGVISSWRAWSLQQRCKKENPVKEGFALNTFSLSLFLLWDVSDKDTLYSSQILTADRIVAAKQT
jgi:hypothetical protein